MLRLLVSPCTAIPKSTYLLPNSTHLSNGTNVSFLGASGVLYSYYPNPFNQNNLAHEEEFTPDFTDLHQHVFWQGVTGTG